ncbi:hypothetical protein ACK350_07105 [Aeromonas veronii]
MKKIVIDLDGTITIDSAGPYAGKKPNMGVVNKLVEYKSLGYTIVIHTARNMRTFSGEVGKINVHTLPTIISWLNDHGIPFDEIIVGKPWCGTDGFYVDDKAIRPSEFASNSLDEILLLLDKENNFKDSGQE